MSISLPWLKKKHEQCNAVRNGAMVEEESKDGAINTVCTVWNAAPPIDGIRPNGQNLARNILTSFANIILLTIVVSWYCHGTMVS